MFVRYQQQLIRSMMKWILAILLLISGATFGQVDDTTKYIAYPFQYGMKMPRIWAPTTMIMPYGDTTGRRPGKVGAFMTCSCDSNVYRWNGSNWVAFGGTPARFGLEDASTTANRSFNFNNFTFEADSFSNYNLFSKAQSSGVDRGVVGQFRSSPTSSYLWHYHSNGVSTRSYGFNAYPQLTQMFAAGHAPGHATYVQSDTLQVILEADPNRLYMFHDSAVLHNITGGNIDFRIRTLPQTIDTSYKSLVSGPNGRIYLRPGDNGGGTPGSPPNSLQFNNSGFKGDSLQYYPAENKILTSQDYIQYGRPVTGFFQDSAWNYTNGKLWMVYPRHSNGTPGQAVDPSWGGDTLQPFFGGVANALYDTTRSENPVLILAQFGQTGSYRPMASIRLEQKWYNNIEYHALTTKPHLMNPNDEVRNWSWTVNDQNGAANLTTRSSDNRWGFPIVNSPHYDKEYAVLDAQKFELKAISNPAFIYARAGYLQQWHIGMQVDTSTQAAYVDAQGVATLSLGSVSNNEIVIQNPGTGSGLILANKSFVVSGKQLQVGGLANGALGFSVTSGANGYIWQTNSDANGYGQTYSNGAIEINRDPLGFANGSKMFSIYNNYNANDSIFHIRGNGDLYTKGMITANADSTASATGGFLYRDAATGNFRLTAAPGGGSSYTFSNGLTESGGTAKWGGILIENTDIDNDGFSFFSHGAGDHTFRTTNGTSQYNLGTAAGACYMNSNNSSTNLFSEINSLNNEVTIAAGHNGSYYNEFKADSSGFMFTGRINTTPKVFKITNLGIMSNDAYGSGAIIVTPATTPVYSSAGVIGERIAPKIYTALLSQSGTSAPTATVLGTNEIGSIVWTRSSTGVYVGTLTGAFTSNKIWLICQKGDGSGSFVNGLLSSTSANTVSLSVTDNAGSVTDNFTNMSIEIRVYP